MRRIIGTSLLAMCVWLLPSQSKAQLYELEIDSLVGLPDTIADGEQVTFYMIVSTNSSLFYQGNIYVELEYAGSFYEADTSISANAFLGPVSPTTIQATHRFSSDDGLGIGDNVVVVWPRIGDGVTPDQNVVNPHSQTITLVEPMGIPIQPTIRRRKPFISPNPANNRVSFHLGESVKIVSLRVSDLTGRRVANSTITQSLDVSSFKKGIYIVEVLTENGVIYYDRVLVAP